VRFPEVFWSVKRFRVTRASLAGNAGRTARAGRKILPLAASIAEEVGSFEWQKPLFYWVFCDGTGFADSSA
jgi:hypothetical protein